MILNQPPLATCTWEQSRERRKGHILAFTSVMLPGGEDYPLRTQSYAIVLGEEGELHEIEIECLTVEVFLR